MTARMEKTREALFAACGQRITDERIIDAALAEVEEWDRRYKAKKREWEARALAAEEALQQAAERADTAERERDEAREANDGKANLILHEALISRIEAKEDELADARRELDEVDFINADYAALKARAEAAEARADSLERATPDVPFSQATEHREGMMEVYDWTGRYAGCIGSETWTKLVMEAKAGAGGAADSKEGT